MNLSITESSQCHNHANIQRNKEEKLNLTQRLINMQRIWTLVSGQWDKAKYFNQVNIKTKIIMMNDFFGQRGKN